VKPGTRVRSLSTGWGGVVLPYTGNLQPDEGWCYVRWDNGVESYGATAFLRGEAEVDSAPTLAEKSRPEISS
jgi:hypothetical protein